jgi:hypothetical protein
MIFYHHWFLNLAVEYTIQEGPRRQGGTGNEWDTSAFVCAAADDVVNLLGENMHTIKRNAEAQLDAS